MLSQVGKTLLNTLTRSLISNRGDDTPPDLLTGLIFHVDAMDLSSIVKDGSDNVSAWNGIFPTTVNLLQADSDRQPKYEAMGFGDTLPTINFFNQGGFSRSLFAATDINIVDHTFVIVTSPNAFTNTEAGGMLGAQDQNAGFDSFDSVITNFPYGAANIYYVEHGGGGGFQGNYTPTDNELALMTYTHNSTTEFLYHNKDLIGSQLRSPDPKSNIYIYIGPRNLLNSPDEYYDGKVSEAYIYNRVLTSQERTLLQNQLMIKWGIPGADSLLLEDSSNILLEDGSLILLE